jgi:hypothetical protein
MNSGQTYGRVITRIRKGHYQIRFHPEFFRQKPALVFAKCVDILTEKLLSGLAKYMSSNMQCAFLQAFSPHTLLTPFLSIINTSPGSRSLT